MARIFASGILAGMNVVIVRCLSDRDIDVDDLRAKAGKHGGRLLSSGTGNPALTGRARLRLFPAFSNV